MNIDLFGFFAAFLTTSAFLPQVIKILRERDTKAISLPMYAIFTAGVACWLVYGFLVGSWPVIASNSVTLLLSLTILICKIKNGD